MRLLTQVDYDNIQNDYNNIVNTYIPQQIDNSIIYTTSSADYPTFNVSRNIKGIICSVGIWYESDNSYGSFSDFVFMPMLNRSAGVIGCTTSTSSSSSLRGAKALRISYTTNITSFRITSVQNVDSNYGTYTCNTTSCIIFT